MTSHHCHVCVLWQNDIFVVLYHTDIFFSSHFSTRDIIIGCYQPGLDFCFSFQKNLNKYKTRTRTQKSITEQLITNDYVDSNPFLSFLLRNFQRYIRHNSNNRVLVSLTFVSLPKIRAQPQSDIFLHSLLYC